MLTSLKDILQQLEDIVSGNRPGKDAKDVLLQGARLWKKAHHLCRKS